MDIEAAAEDSEQIHNDTFVHLSQVLHQFSAFRKKGLFCDFNIIVDGENMPVHRNVICASSKYFEAMLTRATAENKNGKVELKGMDKDSVVTCIAFMYGEPLLTSGSCVDKWARLVLAADMLQLEGLLISIISFLTVKLNIETLDAMYALSKKFCLLNLEHECVRFAALNLESLSKSDKVKHLDVELFDKLINTTGTVKATESTILAALIVWTNWHKEVRSKPFAIFLRKLDLSKVKMPYRRYLMENEPLVKDSLANLTLISVSILNSVGVSSEKYTEDHERNGLLVYLGQLNRIHLISCVTGEARSVNVPIPFGVNFSVLSLRQYVYIFAHKSAFQIELDVFDGLPAVRERGKMLYDHGRRPTLVANSRHIYAVEGCEVAREACIEEYNPVTDTWRFLTSGKGFRNHACVLFDKLIFCIGGIIACRITASVLAYHLVEHAWVKYPSLPAPRKSAAAAVLGQSVYVVGGRTTVDEILATSLVLDTRSNVWSSIAPMWHARAGCSAFPILGAVYVCGGCDASARNPVERYCPAEAKWMDGTLPVLGTTILCSASVTLEVCESVRFRIDATHN